MRWSWWGKKIKTGQASCFISGRNDCQQQQKITKMVLNWLIPKKIQQMQYVCMQKNRLENKNKEV